MVFPNVVAKVLANALVLIGGYFVLMPMPGVLRFSD